MIEGRGRFVDNFFCQVNGVIRAKHRHRNEFMLFIPSIPGSELGETSDDVFVGRNTRSPIVWSQLYRSWSGEVLHTPKSKQSLSDVMFAYIGRLFLLEEVRQVLRYTLYSTTKLEN